MLIFRKANLKDVEDYYVWANDPIVRAQSFTSDSIDLENHKKWFSKKLKDPNCTMLVFQTPNLEIVGQVRIEKIGETDALIGTSIVSEFRGKGYAKKMLDAASEYFLSLFPFCAISAYIKIENLTSKNAFEKAGFKLTEITNYKGFQSFHYKRNKI